LSLEQKKNWLIWKEYKKTMPVPYGGASFFYM